MSALPESLMLYRTYGAVALDSEHHTAARAHHFLLRTIVVLLFLREPASLRSVGMALVP